MADFLIKRYMPEFRREWNDFVETSKNGTFLLNRDYMDYHSDRFPDCSLTIFRNGKLFALLPASASADVVCSHPGLTYGGLVVNRKATVEETMEIFTLVCSHFADEGFSTFIYKPVPHIYHRLPAEEDLYALFRAGATIKARNVSAVVCRDSRLPFRKIRIDGIRRALAAGVRVEESSDFAPFWNVLTNNLLSRYSTLPVHSLTEIEKLAARFPENIRLFTAMKEGCTLGGVLVYITPTVVHTQYISASQEGKSLGVIDLVMQTLLDRTFPSHRYFDFGTSNEKGGKFLNASLIYQKEGFGGRAVCYDTYETDLHKFSTLQTR